MDPRRSVLVAATLLGACHHPLDPIQPSAHFTGRLLEPRLHGDPFAVAVDILVPKGYSMQLRNNLVRFWRHSWDPAIELDSAAVTYFDEHPEPLLNRDCSWETIAPDDADRVNPKSGSVGQVVKDEPRPDGWVIVCKYRDPTDGSRSARVIRDLRWRGSEYQCGVSFFDDPDVTVPCDHGDPSPARIDDAIAICDSMKVRDITPDEVGLNWNGTTWTKTP